MSSNYTPGSDFVPREGDIVFAQIDEKCRLFTDETGLQTSFYPHVADSPYGLLTVCKPMDSTQVSKIDTNIQELITKLTPITVEELGLVVKLIEDLQMSFNYAFRQKPLNTNIQGKLPALLSYDVIPQHSPLVGESPSRIERIQ